jgi:hypothetical protein
MALPYVNRPLYRTDAVFTKEHRSGAAAVLDKNGKAFFNSAPEGLGAGPEPED